MVRPSVGNQVIAGHWGRGVHMKLDESEKRSTKQHRLAQVYGNDARSVLQIPPDFVVKYQALDIIGVIHSPTW
jgi:hypothetical protein